MPSQEQGFFKTLARPLRRLMSAFKEKPDTRLDEYMHEHLMLYHCLVGTSPDNQRDFKDVRQDIFDALAHGSSVEMTIALKLPPLFWEEKLAVIFAEAKNHYDAQLEKCLLPKGETFELEPQYDPLRHPDWRVRANAARMMAYLNMEQAVPRMVNALNDSAVTQKAAFMHLAYSLAKLQSESSRQALVAHLNDDEPWFAVDAAGALSQWPLQAVAHDLLSSLLNVHPLLDYTSAAIIRNHSLDELLGQTDEQSREGVLELVLALLAADAGQTAPGIAAESRLNSYLPRLAHFAREKPTPRRWRTVTAACSWANAHCDDILQQDKTTSARALRQELNDLQDEFSSEKLRAPVLDWLRKTLQDDPKSAQLRHAAGLIGEFQIADAAPLLLQIADTGKVAVDEAVEALGALHYKEAAPHLVRLLESCVDLDERTAKQPSKQPVFEEDPLKATTYWHILRALKNMPTPEALECLLRASRDFAADKRQQALASLAELGEAPEISRASKTQIASRVQEALHDPAASVKVAALKGVSTLAMTTALEAVIHLANAPETAVWRQASLTLNELKDAGHGKAVTDSLSAAIAQERNEFRRKRLQDLLG